MVNRKRGFALFQCGNGRQGHRRSRSGCHINTGQTVYACLKTRSGFEHHFILIGLGENGGNQALAKGIVKRVVHIRHADAQSRRGGSVYVHISLQTLILPIAAHVFQLRQLLQRRNQLRHPLRQLRRIGRLQGETVRVTAGGGFYRQILYRLDKHLGHLR